MRRGSRGTNMTKATPVRERLRQTYGDGDTKPRRKNATDPATIEKVVLEHVAQVRRVARRVARSTGGAIEADDLFSVGVIGLIQAHESYDSTGGRPFHVYAEYRIRGSMLDEMRRLDPMSQPMRKKARMLDKAINKLSHTLSRAPTEEELAAQLDLSLEDLQLLRREVQQHRFVAYEDTRIDDLRLNITQAGLGGPGAKLALTDAISKLDARLQQVLALYYFHDLSLKEIGKVLEVTEARVCQLHKQAVAEMRKILEI